MTKPRMWRLLALLCALSLFAIACGGSADDAGTADEPASDAADTVADDTTADGDGDDDEGADTDDADAGDEPAAATGELETTELALGLIPIADVAPVFIGIERGLFEAEGLTVTTEFAAGGAAAIPSVVAGDIDLAFGAYPSAINAISQGIELQIVTEAVRGGELFAGLYSLPDSGIESPADMAGATVAVNTLNNIVQIAVQVALEGEGLTLDDVTLVEIPFPDMVAALELGDVDVISTVEPFGTIARGTLDAQLVIDMFSGPLTNFPVAGFYSTTEWAEANPNTLAAFNRAFAAATDIANNEEGALAAIVPTYTSASPEAAAGLNYPNMVSGLDVDFLQQVADFMINQGILDEPVNIADHIAG